LILASCSSPVPFAKISVSETNGLSREQEYVTIEIPLPIDLKSSQMLLVTDHDTGELIIVQVLDTIENEGKSSLKIMFPVNVEANEIKTFDLLADEKMRDAMPFGLRLSYDGSSVENQIYKASFSTKLDPRGGQINGIILKDFDDRLLKRGHIAMHWAPNFSRSDVNGYYNMENLPTNSENRIEKGRYQITKKRSGNTEKISEINVEGKYTFFADAPYFFFESTMTMEKDVSLKLLRNDEMTIDSLFTHVAYQKLDGTIDKLNLYDDELDSLETNPIPDDSRFVAFYNINHKYGFASIRLKYDNMKRDGSPSPMFNPHTKISKSRNNGRYWNRVLIDSATTATMGSRYHEKNA